MYTTNSLKHNKLDTYKKRMKIDNINLDKGYKQKRKNSVEG